MNRIIILGNGFDLAHSLKTKFEHFLLSELNKALKSKKSLFKIRTIYDPFKFKFESFNEGLDHITKLSQTSIESENELLKRSYKTHKWVDFERSYYEYLLECLDKSGDFDFTGLVHVNADLDKIKSSFENYLQIDLDTDSNKIESFTDIFNQEFKPEDFSYTEDQVGQQVDNFCFLNFNYTKTINQYLVDSEKYRLINIHGEVGSESNPIIFGYGDELDKQYSTLEMLNSNEVLTHFKSPQYLLTSNYFNLLKFIESGNYQVYIIGHSCGLTDRTLLNHVFEHDHCKSIKVFYHETRSNFQETVLDISRNFRDKSKLRSRLVSFENSKKCPQSQ